MERRFNLRQVLVFTGGLLGLIAGTVIGLRRMGIALLFPDSASGPQPPSGDAWIGQIAFLLVFTLPFALSLLALRSDRTPLQSVIWVGSGLLALVGAFFSFSVMTVILLPVPGVLLLAGGGIAFVRPEVKKSVPVILLALALVIAGGGSFYVLFNQENPACWSQVRTVSGENVWEPSPPGATPPVVVGDPEAGDIVAWSCSSDVIVAAEGLSSMGIWALAVVGLIGIGRTGILE